MKFSDFNSDWALVTGASSGIGKEFAYQLAERGLNIILVARREKILRKVAEDIEERFKCKTLVIPTDLTISKNIYNIRKILRKKHLKIRLLVNNAGFGIFGNFEGYSLDIDEYIVKLNIIAPIFLTKLFLDDMLSFEKSAIINVSSQAITSPVPYLSVYTATKAFISSFSMAINEEFKDKKIIVQTLIIGPTKTDFIKKAKIPQGLFKEGKNPKYVVKKSLNGLEKEKSVVTTAKGFSAQKILFDIFPNFFIKQIAIKMKKRVNHNK